MKKVLFPLILLLFACKNEPKQETNKNDSLVTYTVNKYINNKARVDLQSSLPKSKNDIVFLGDSKTEGFPLSEIFQDVSIKNRGIGGNTTQDVLDRLNTITEGHPKKIFLEIGLNDISNNISPQKTFQNFVLICKRISDESSETKLIVQSITPTAKDQKGLNPKINQYNNLIQNFCKKNKIEFIDLHENFLKGSELNNEYTIDGVHLNAKGYILWSKILEPYI